MGRYNKARLLRAGEFGLILFDQSRDRFYIEMFDEYLLQIIKRIEKRNKDASLEQQAMALEGELYKKIEAIFLGYRKDDIIFITLAIKDALRQEQLKMKASWERQSDFDVALLLQKMVLPKKSDEFRGSCFSLYDDVFVEAIYYCQIVILLKENLKRNQFLKFAKRLRDFTDTLYENQMLIDHYENLLRQCDTERPEDFVIVNENLLKILKSRRLTSDDIYEKISNTIEELVGFDFEDLNKLQIIVQCEGFIIANRNWLISRIKKNISKEKLEKIIDFFSINSLLDKPYQELSERKFELKSIYCTDDFMAFACLDLVQNIEVFKKIVFSGHFLQMYFLEESNQTVFQQVQREMTTFISYVLGDQLETNGYIIPKIKIDGHNIIQVEIGKILNEAKVNILQGIGDIDVLAVNINKKEILNIEFKYYKPSMDFSGFLKKDKKVEEKDKAFTKMIKRHKVIEENLELVLRFVVNQYCVNSINEYKVRSIIITARPNYYCLKQKEVEYLTFAGFIKQVQEKVL